MGIVSYVEKNLLNIKSSDGKDDGAAKDSKEAKESKESEALRVKIGYVRFYMQCSHSLITHPTLNWHSSVTRERLHIDV